MIANTHNATPLRHAPVNKAQILSRFSADPDRYYTVELFAQEGYARAACRVCGRFYWSANPNRDTCPDHDPEMYSFIGRPPTNIRLDYTESWRKIKEFFVSNNHTSIPRYPVVCRWRDDLYYTIASIVDFQRVSGSHVTFQFPANPLIIPQTCLRFKDIENVGVTGRHFSSFCMVGQHSVPDTGGYWKDTCIRLDHSLLTGPFGIPSEEITFVEDVWGRRRLVRPVPGVLCAGTGAGQRGIHRVSGDHRGPYNPETPHNRHGRRS